VIDHFPAAKFMWAEKRATGWRNILVYETNDDFMPMKVTHARVGMLETDLPKPAHPEASL